MDVAKSSFCRTVTADGGRRSFGRTVTDRQIDREREAAEYCNKSVGTKSSVGWNRRALSKEVLNFIVTDSTNFLSL